MRTCIVLSSLAAACTEPVELTSSSTPSSDEPTDLRRDFPPPASGGVQFVTPEYVIPPGTEQQWCYITRYTGPDMGIHAQWTYQSPSGHHVTLNATNADEDDYPDGTFLECTEPEDMPMTNLEPLIVGGTGNQDAPDGPEGSFVLPDGMAAELEGDTRIVLQSHYVNATADSILVQDAINLDLVEPESVETWAAPVVHLDLDFALPPGPSSLSFDCAFDQELDLLFLAGHMHEWGTAFSTVLTRAGAEPEVLYDIPSWDPTFRDAAPTTAYEQGQMRLSEGDRFTTNCAWDNDTDGVLTFPQEMCVTFAMAYPLKSPIVCTP
jgi:hypothetical protein